MLEPLFTRQMRRTNPLIFALCAILACLATASAAQGNPRPEQLLRAAVNAPNHVSFVGQVQTISYGQSRSEAEVYRIEHDAPEATRRWYIAPQSLYGDSMVSRGSTIYDIDVKHNRVIVSKDDAIDDQVTLDDNFGLLLHNYRAVMGPNDSVAGRVALTVLLVNKYTGQSALRIWIDAEKNLVLQKEQYAGNGAITSSMRFEAVRFVADLPDQVFQVPNAGYERVKGANHGIPSNDLAGVVRTAGFPARFPRTIPHGFVPVTGDVTEIRGVRSLHLLYSDGVRTISLFENAKGAAVDLNHFRPHDVSFQSHNGQVVEDGPTTLLAWAESGLHFALVGDLSPNELTKIAASVAP